MGKRVEAIEGFARELMEILKDRESRLTDTCKNAYDVFNYNPDPRQSIKNGLSEINKCMNNHFEEKLSLLKQLKNLQDTAPVNPGFQEFNANKVALGLSDEITDINTANKALAILKATKMKANRLPVCESQRELLKTKYDAGYETMNNYCKDHKKEAQTIDNKYNICKELCNDGWVFTSWGNDCTHSHEEL